MNGTKILFDTNTLISFLNGVPSLAVYADAQVALSIISVIEFLSYRNLSLKDKASFDQFIKILQVIDLSFSNKTLVITTTEIRKEYNVKIPDAVIAATAIVLNIPLVTNDSDFKKINRLETILY